MCLRDPLRSNTAAYPRPPLQAFTWAWAARLMLWSTSHAAQAQVNACSAGLLLQSHAYRISTCLDLPVQVVVARIEFQHLVVKVALENADCIWPFIAQLPSKQSRVILWIVEGQELAELAVPLQDLWLS